MIEQGLYFGLGCAVAGLLALGAMPVLWARALRLTRQRLQVQIPVSMQEILADRDHLRADFAVERRKLEQEMERVRARQATVMGELGRRTMEAAALGQALAAAEAVGATQRETMAVLTRAADEQAAQAGALAVGLHDTHAFFESRLADHQALQRDHATLEGVAEERRTTVAGLNTRVMGLEMTIEDARRAYVALERQHAGVKESLVIAEAGRALAEGLRRDLDAAKARAAALEGELAAAKAGLAEGREREKGLHLERGLQAEKTRGAERLLGEKLDALRAENAALRDTLAAHTVAAPAQPDGDAALRARIHALGLSVARLAEAGARTADTQSVLSA